MHQKCMFISIIVCVLSQTQLIFQYYILNFGSIFYSFSVFQDDHSNLDEAYLV